MILEGCPGFSITPMPEVRFGFQGTGFVGVLFERGIVPIPELLGYFSWGLGWMGFVYGMGFSSFLGTGLGAPNGFEAGLDAPNGFEAGLPKGFPKGLEAGSGFFSGVSGFSNSSYSSTSSSNKGFSLLLGFTGDLDFPAGGGLD